MKKILITICIVLFFITLFGQNPGANLNLYSMGTLGYDLLDVSQKRNDSISLPGVMFPLKASQISTIGLQSKFPQFNIPLEQFELSLPDLRNYVDTFVVLWYIRDFYWNQNPILNVMLVCSKADKTIDYFVDINNNRNFLDDVNPVDFRQNKSSRVEINIRDILYLINLSNPNYSELNSQKLSAASQRNRLDVIEAWMNSRKKPKFNLLFSLTSCPGKVREDFEPVIKEDNVKNFSFSGNVETSFSFDIGSSISYYGFNLGGIFSLEKNHFSAQYVTAYYKEPVVLDSKNGTVVLNELSKTGGNWPDVRYSYGAFVSYDLCYMDWVVSPSAEIGSFKFKTDLVFVKGLTLKYQDFIKDPVYYKFGGDIKYLIGKNVGLLVRMHYKITKYNNFEFYNQLYKSSANGIIESSYKQKYTQLFVGLGFQFRL
jgi:hypothetical protein